MFCSCDADLARPCLPHKVGWAQWYETHDVVAATEGLTLDLLSFLVLKVVSRFVVQAQPSPFDER